MTDQGKTVAREYLRVSLDASGRERSVDEQHAENQRAADAHGWTLGEAYREQPTSASRYATKSRKQFDALIRDLESDRFDAHVLVLWESSRGSRRVSEWAKLIDLCEDRSVRIHVTTHRRTYDPTNYRDRAAMQEDAVDSERESGKISERTKRAMRANAAAGVPQGRIPFGYRRVYDERTGRLVRQEPEPTEAQVVRELYDRLKRGHAMKAIARDFHARGVRSRSGTVLTAQQLRDMAIKRLYNGQREYEGQVIDAQWPALVDRATWHMVQRRLTRPEGRKPRPGRASHLLSMIARCDPCGGALTVNYRQGKALYRCHEKGCVRVAYHDLNELAEAAILGYLARPDNVERLTADTDGPDLARVRDEIASIEAEHADLVANVAAGKLSATLATGAEPGILARLEAAREREADLMTPSQLRGLISPGADVARRWKAAPMSAKREVARLLLNPDVIGELRVAHSPIRGHRAPITDRTVWKRT